MDLRNTNNASRLKVLADGRGLASFTAAAWAKFSQSGTPSFSAQHNCSSITDLGTGNSQVNYTNALANSDYAVVRGQGPESDFGEELMAVAETTTYVRFLNVTQANSRYDNTRCNFAAFQG